MSGLNKQPEVVEVHLQIKRPRRFKAGSEANSSAVNLVIDVEEKGEISDFKLQLTFGSGSCKAD